MWDNISDCYFHKASYEICCLSPKRIYHFPMRTVRKHLILISDLFAIINQTGRLVYKLCGINYQIVIFIRKPLGYAGGL